MIVLGVQFSVFGFQYGFGLIARENENFFDFDERLRNFEISAR